MKYINLGITANKGIIDAGGKKFSFPMNKTEAIQLVSDIQYHIQCEMGCYKMSEKREGMLFNAFTSENGEVLLYQIFHDWKPREEPLPF